MLNDQQQTKKLFADGWTMIKGCSTDYSTTDSTEKKIRPPVQKNYKYNSTRRTQNWSDDNWQLLDGLLVFDDCFN